MTFNYIIPDAFITQNFSVKNFSFVTDWLISERERKCMIFISFQNKIITS